ncbi:TlpA family protein disulfide reductase [Mucilaginibacter ximonensis]|uniref:TlpA family protein disulfide reductase n=1 Tax=Mucilaginibacter ximonensis TaxID=538021 RepID=A0ABW5YCE5_9SPHI
MKYFYLLLIALVFASCSNNQLKITGTTDGLEEVTMSLKDGSGQTLTAVNAKDGRFELECNLNGDDYGTLTLSRPGKPDIITDLYLEPGEYTVAYNSADVATAGQEKYPKIVSTSAIQNQLSAYHATYEHMAKVAGRKIRELDAKYVQERKSKIWDDSLTALATKTEKERTKLLDVGRMALADFVSKNPDNQIAVHIFQDLNYEADPVGYYVLFLQLSREQQKSEEGKGIGVKLNALIHLVPGALAPTIVGTMPDGKKLDLKTMHKKLILVEFWRAANYQSRLNHQEMIKKPWKAFTDGQLGITSISFDKKRDWWLGSMRDDKLTWPQVSDLKGTDSPNFDNWAISSFPVYYLLDGNGRIVEPDLQFSEIPLVVDRHLKAAKL